MTCFFNVDHLNDVFYLILHLYVWYTSIIYFLTVKWFTLVIVFDIIFFSSNSTWGLSPSIIWPWWFSKSESSYRDKFEFPLYDHNPVAQSLNCYHRERDSNCPKSELAELRLEPRTSFAVAILSSRPPRNPSIVTCLKKISRWNCWNNNSKGLGCAINPVVLFANFLVLVRATIG